MITSFIAAVSIIIGLVAWDIFLAADSIDNNTWSEVLRFWGQKTLVIPWLWGVLGGHFFHFWTTSNPIIERPGNFIFLIWVTVVIAIVSFILNKMGANINMFMLATMYLGSIAGFLLWPVG